MSAFDSFQHYIGSPCKHWTVYDTFKFMAYELHLKKFLKCLRQRVKLIISSLLLHVNL